MRRRAVGTLVLITLTLWIGSACSAFPAQSAQSPKSIPTETPSAPASPGTVGGQVPTPVGFPADFPIYPGARLTAAANFSSSGSTSWGLEWQTADSSSKVHMFFAGALKAGDWTLLTSSGTATTTFLSTFRRKSDLNVKGTLTVSASAGVTKITLVLTTVP